MSQTCEEFCSSVVVNKLHPPFSCGAVLCRSFDHHPLPVYSLGAEGGQTLYRHMLVIIGSRGRVGNSATTP
jgi:hypothetical protein